MSGAALCIGGPRAGRMWASPLDAFDAEREHGTPRQLLGKYVYHARRGPYLAHWRWVAWIAPAAERELGVSKYSRAGQRARQLAQRIGEGA